MKSLVCKLQWSLVGCDRDRLSDEESTLRLVRCALREIPGARRPCRLQDFARPFAPCSLCAVLLDRLSERVVGIVV